jgi:hypothetical protein
VAGAESDRQLGVRHERCIFVGRVTAFGHFGEPLSSSSAEGTGIVYLHIPVKSPLAFRLLTLPLCACQACPLQFGVTALRSKKKQ